MVTKSVSLSRQILAKGVLFSNHILYEVACNAYWNTLFSTYDKVYSLKRIRKDKDKDEDPSAGSDRGLKKMKTSKDAEPTKGPKAKESQSGSSKGNKSQPKSFGKFGQSEELEFEALSEKLDWENSEGGDYPFDLTKPLPLVVSENRQKVLVNYFFNNDLKYLQGGVSTMTYTTSITKKNAIQYDLLGIEDMTFCRYARGLESRHDVYSMKRILEVTQVEVMRKHRYGYLKEIVVRRADNDLYRFKEGDFLRLRINNIEDMLLLVF
ncbi:hypothetical protein Tco_0910895 [Tanacetum coccineum]|uniref:Uncharacterized protein n=1 Tax=Tanacetum coccineum TaxID=301880 RepID=A0ABQ5CU72_9ASTR